MNDQLMMVRVNISDTIGCVGQSWNTLNGLVQGWYNLRRCLLGASMEKSHVRSLFEIFPIDLFVEVFMMLKFTPIWSLT